MSAGLRRSLLYGVLALVLMGFCWVQGRASAIDDLTLEHAQAVLNGHQGYERALEALRGREADFVRSEAFWRAKADSLGRQMGNQIQRPLASKNPQELLVPASASDSLRVIFLGRALDACDASRSAADSALALCRVRGDSLEAALRGVLAIKTCRLPFGIPCPSRGALFVLGAVSGAILENRLSR